MTVFIVTRNIGNYEERKFTSDPFTDTEVFETYLKALREAGWSRKWYIKEGFHELYRELMPYRKDEYRYHLLRVVLANEKQNQWVAIEINRHMIH